MSECAFGPHAALAKKPEMLMYNMYTPLSELFAALPADQIHHSDPAPLPPYAIEIHDIAIRPPSGGGPPYLQSWRKNLKWSCTTCTLRFQNFSPPCLRTKSIILTHPLDSDTAPRGGIHYPLSIILTQPLDSDTAPRGGPSGLLSSDTAPDRHASCMLLPRSRLRSLFIVPSSLVVENKLMHLYKTQ